MKETSKNLKAHLIMCTSCKFIDANGSECDSTYASNLRKTIKAEVADKFGKESIRVSGATCLGHCKEGIAAVLYPNSKWFVGIRENDKDQLIQEISNVCNN